MISITDDQGRIRFGLIELFWQNSNTCLGYSGIVIEPLGEDGYILLMLGISWKYLFTYDFYCFGKHFQIIGDL